MDTTKEDERSLFIELTKRDLEIEERYNAMSKVIAEQKLIWESEFETFRNYCEEKLKEQREKWNSISAKIEMTNIDVKILKLGAGKTWRGMWNRIEAIEKKKRAQSSPSSRMTRISTSNNQNVFSSENSLLTF
jgi:hypothetical protein